jgi:hypothetical protein
MFAKSGDDVCNNWERFDWYLEKTFIIIINLFYFVLYINRRTIWLSFIELDIYFLKIYVLFYPNDFWLLYKPTYLGS